MKWSTQKSIVFQAGIIKLCANITQAPVIQVSAPVAEQRVVKSEPVAQVQNKVTQKIPPKPKAQMGTSGNITKEWPKIVSNLKDSGKIVLYTNLINTEASELNDMTVGIQFKNGITSFGKAVLEKQENIHELTKLVSMACGKEMQIKYIEETNQAQTIPTVEESLQSIANASDIPFNIID